MRSAKDASLSEASQFFLCWGFVLRVALSFRPILKRRWTVFEIDDEFFPPTYLHDFNEFLIG